MRNIHSQESGRSMVEMLGVLAIIGVLSVGGIAGYSQAMAKFKITKTIDQVQTIITNLRTLYSGSRKYSAITAAQAYSLGLLNDETYTGSKGLNPYGGNIVFGTADSGRTFTIEYNGLTPEACVRLATADWGADSSSGLKTIKVNSSTHGWKSDDSSTYKDDDTMLPIALSSAVTQCGSASNGSVTWKFR